MLCATGFTPAAAQHAATDGARMVEQHVPYGVRPWLLYQSPDPLRAVHGRAGVDAIVVETPYERLRYEAYLDALQGIRVTPRIVAAWRRQAQHEVGFLVYAHSRSQYDRSFLQRFHPAPAARFGPSDDFFDVGSFREQRWVGSITYRYPVSNCNERGVLRFTDGYGRQYHLPFNLSRYQ